MSPRLAVLAALLPLALAACAGLPPATSTKAPAEQVWAFEKSDIPVDPGFRFGRLHNGMRYVVRHNATPAGTAIVRMEVRAGSLDEGDAEQGFAHFVEHMAFNGSTHVPEGEMIRLLEREGLAFGADTNAATGFEQTQYKLDLPRNDPALLDRALMLMRETASELTFSPEAVARERGVVLAEMRDRNSFSYRNGVESAQFLHPRALYPRRFPIGTVETLNGASADTLKAFWQREYVPQHTTVVVIGDFDAALVEAKLREHFADWQGLPAQPQPRSGPILFRDKGRVDVYVDPALTERIEADRHGPWLDEPDTIAQRRENLLREIGYAIVNRRFQRISRQPSPPFRGAGFGTGAIFEDGRSTRLIVDTSDRKWRDGLIAATREYRRALKTGFTPAEVAEQLATIRTGLEDAAAGADTRSNQALESAVWSLLDDKLVPSDPREVLSRFTTFAPLITPKAVLTALKREVVTIRDPLLRFRGRVLPDGGASAIRAAWKAAVRQPLGREMPVSAGTFAYTDFGPAGTVASDTREPGLGIRTIRFVNGVMLNLKHTDIEKDRVLLKLSVDGGDMADTIAAPFASELVPYLAEGGLGRHSEDELQTMLAGRTVDNEFRSEDAFVTATAATTPRDLELQLQVLAAYLTDPGYRPEGVERYRQDINRFFAQLRATPSAALGNAIGGIVSDNDPRFSLKDASTYRKLTYADLSKGMGDRLARGAIEIGMVGDFDEAQAIALVAKTFGALPMREPAFRGSAGQPPRRFTADRTPRIVRHTGPADQAIVRLQWPTRDDSDPLATLTLELLERIARIEMTDTLREALGKAYSPGAASTLAHAWPGYGTFNLTASVAVTEVPAARQAMLATLNDLRGAPVSADLLQRARQPMIEQYQNALKTNAGWLDMVEHTQGEADRIDRFLKARQRLESLTTAEVQAAARAWLDPARALEVLVLPEGVEVPKAIID